ncbi:MAG: ABC transporter substrate-binding protein [Spirochaetales bacterium]|nr:ABC transporter substrate-binding protein [Spirochaetales bacterium]
MKRFILTFCLILFLSVTLIFAGGGKEKGKAEKVIRVAEQVPGLITPGVWDGQAFSMNSSIYEFLVEMNSDTSLLEPLLATSWHNDDGSRWTFNLRQDVYFHDGSPFTAEDVKFTIERTQDPSIGHLKKQDFEIVESIETPDPYTVVINLREPRPTFIYQLTDYNMAILSSEYDYERYGETKPMGTGPFVLERLIPKEAAQLVKNTNYWDSAYPIVDGINIYFVPDIEASISMLESGQVDIVPFVSQVIGKRLKESNDDIEIISPYQEMRFISMRVDEEPFNDNRVRLALKYAMDPYIIARSVAQMELGDGVYYNETPIMNLLPQYKEIDLRRRDIDKAKELLTEAGYPNGFEVDLYYASDHPFGKELSQTVQELALEAGIRINLKGYTRDVYLAQYWLNVPLSITGWAGRPDVSMLLHLAFRGGGSWNESHIDAPVLNTLIDKISVESDEDLRLRYYHQLQDFFFEEGSLINVQVPLLIATSKRVVNYRHPLTQIPQYKYFDLK